MNITVGQTIRIKDGITGKTVRGEVLEVIGGEWSKFVLLVNEVEQWDCNSENCTILPTPSEMRKINTYIRKNEEMDKLGNEIDRLDCWSVRFEEGIDKDDYKKMKKNHSKLQTELERREEGITATMRSYMEEELNFSIAWGGYM